MNPWTFSISAVDPKPTDWVKHALQALNDAKLLLRAGSIQNAYVMAGLAVELAFKGRIMHSERLNTWPSRKSRPDIHTHNLGKLMSVAKLRSAIEQELLLGSDIGLAWMVVKDFDINGRYPLGKEFPVKLAEDFVEAIDRLGLVRWLTTGIQ